MAAVSASTAGVYLTHKGLPLSPPKNIVSTLIINSSMALASKTAPRFLSIRCSGDAASSIEPSGTEEAEPDSSIELPQGTPSIISALNVERALRGIPITDVDHYGRLGLPRGCSNDQVFEAYKIKTEELLSQGLETEELNQQIEMLKESYTILSTVEERRLYDWSLARTEKPDRYVWPFEVDSSRPPLEEPPEIQLPEDVGATIAVGYFMLGWMVLSVVLSIALNR